MLFRFFLWYFVSLVIVFLCVLCLLLGKSLGDISGLQVLLIRSMLKIDHFWWPLVGFDVVD